MFGWKNNAYSIVHNNVYTIASGGINVGQNVQQINAIWFLICNNLKQK